MHFMKCLGFAYSSFFIIILFTKSLIWELFLLKNYTTSKENIIYPYFSTHLVDGQGPMMKVTISCSATWSGKLKDVNTLSVCQDAAPDHSRDSTVTRD